MKVRVKICGLSTFETLEAAIAAGADMAGFMFFPKSPRHLTLDQAARLGVQAAGRIEKVAVVVDAGDDAIAAIIAALKPDLLQLHGHETPERVEYIRARFGLPVMKVFGVSAPGDVEDALRPTAPVPSACYLTPSHPKVRFCRAVMAWRLTGVCWPR